MKILSKLRKHEVVQKTLSILTITIGGWIIFDKAREWLLTMAVYDKYWYLFAIGLLWLGLIIFDVE